MREEQNTPYHRIYVRQSWLNDALMCPERARLSALHPDTRRENDSAVMGTAVHAGIEAVLNGAIQPDEIGSRAVYEFDLIRANLAEDGKEVTVTNTDPKNWTKHIASMAEAWSRDIYPHVPLGGTTEMKFEVPVTVYEDHNFQYELWYEGTMDYVCANSIWDWKTAARKYYEAEKQSQNIQSAVYATAANKLGLLDYTVNFNFGVMIRNASSTGQIVHVTRTQKHSDWIVSQTIALVNSVLLAKRHLSGDSRWMMNDQHHLCSERWCPVWSLCKGALVGESLTAEEANNG